MANHTSTVPLCRSAAVAVQEDFLAIFVLCAQTLIQAKNVGSVNGLQVSAYWYLLVIVAPSVFKPSEPVGASFPRATHGTAAPVLSPLK